MPLRKRLGRGKRRMLRKKRMGRKLRGSRNTNKIGGPNTAKVTETYDLGDMALNTPYLVNKAGITAGFRAADVAPNFGLYRIAYIQWTLMPYFDTFVPSVAQAGGGAIGNQPVVAPYFYWKMNRYGDAPAVFNGTFLREQGAKAIRVDEKIVKWGYKPNVLLADAAAAGGGSGQVKITPWLSTDTNPGDQAFNLSTTRHYGHLMIAEGAAAGNTTPAIGRLQCKVIYEFKNPRSPIGAAQSPYGGTVGEKLEIKV